MNLNDEIEIELKFDEVLEYLGLTYEQMMKYITKILNVLDMSGWKKRVIVNTTKVKISIEPYKPMSAHYLRIDSKTKGTTPCYYYTCDMECPVSTKLGIIYGFFNQGVAKIEPFDYVKLGWVS